MLVETHIDGYVRDKVAIAIDRLRAFEPEEGYYLAFSGGKDSQCIYHLAVEAGVKFDAHYNLTGIDHPKLVYFIKSNYPDVKRDLYKKSMWKLIEKLGLPFRMKRFCCTELKEHGGDGRICITGVRWEESNQRKNRKPFEVVTAKKEDRKLFNDNDEDRRLFENCMQKGKRVINPIIDWLEEDVWEYLNSRGIEHCKLYDEGYKRLGCIGCPMGHKKGILEDFEKYPKYREMYKRAATRHLEYRKIRGLRILGNWKDSESIIQWWLDAQDSSDKEVEGQISLFDYEVEE
jgi:phosphoadenosine phosphosulfate reductase